MNKFQDEDEPEVVEKAKPSVLNFVRIFMMSIILLMI